MNKKKIKIRLATENDIDELMELSQLWIEKNKGLKKQMLKSCFRLPTYHMMILEYDGKIVGWLSTYFRSSWVNTEIRLFVGSIFTHPQYRMKGVMRMLWEEIERTYDYDIALVDTRLDYPLRLGFVEGTNKLFVKRKPKTVKFINEKENLNGD